MGGSRKFRSVQGEIPGRQHSFAFRVYLHFSPCFQSPCCCSHAPPLSRDAENFAGRVAHTSPGSACQLLAGRLFRSPNYNENRGKEGPAHRSRAFFSGKAIA